MSTSERDLQKKLDEMEAEVNQTTSASQDTSKSIFSQLEIDPSQAKGWIDTSKAWFDSLPKVGKAAVAIGGVWLGFSILGAMLHVVSSILTVGAIGFILYVGYRLFGDNSDRQS